VYVKGHEEVGLLNNLARKTNVMKETLEKQVEGGVKFPGEYMNDVEGPGIIDKMRNFIGI
jgi:hypothetical protein